MKVEAESRPCLEKNTYEEYLHAENIIQSHQRHIL